MLRVLSHRLQSRHKEQARAAQLDGRAGGAATVKGPAGPSFILETLGRVLWRDSGQWVKSALVPSRYCREMNVNL